MTATGYIAIIVAIVGVGAYFLVQKHKGNKK